MTRKTVLSFLLSLIVGSAMAVPYASLIRVQDATVSDEHGTTITYILNEPADSVTITIKDSVSATVATFAGTTVQGDNAVYWDVTDNNAGGTKVIPGSGYTVEVSATRNASSGWFEFASNGSLGDYDSDVAQQTIWAGFSPMDWAIQTNPDSDLFGHMFAVVAVNGGPVGLQPFESDLGTRMGGAAADEVMVQPAGGTLAYTDYWGTDFDPDNMDGLYIAGQGSPSTCYADNSAGIQAEATGIDPSDVFSNAFIFPRSMAVINHTDGKYAYYAEGSSSIRKVKLTVTNEVDNAGTNVLSLTNTARYSKDVEFDADGNLYWCSRRDNGAGTNGRVMRWDAADVEAATGGSLTDANATWVVDVATSITNLKNITITPAGDVYTASSEGIFYVGNAATPTMTKTLGNAPGDLVVDFAGFNVDGGGTADWASTSSYGSGIAADYAGNIYACDRGTEVVRAFSPGGNTTINVTAPLSQAFDIATPPAAVRDWTLF